MVTIKFIRKSNPKESHEQSCDRIHYSKKYQEYYCVTESNEFDVGRTDVWDANIWQLSEVK